MPNGQRRIFGPFQYLGSPLTTGKLYHYAAGTATLKNVYTDRGLTTADTQPSEPDANGVFTFFGEIGLYKFTLTDANDTPISIFDNYEIIDPNGSSGTWTPALTFGNGNTGLTYGTQTGAYVRQGDLVFIRALILLTAKGSSTGTARITLPFESIGSAPDGGFNVTGCTNLASLTSAVTAYPETNTDKVVLEHWGATGSSLLTEAHFANTSLVHLSGWYQADPI